MPYDPVLLEDIDETAADIYQDVPELDSDTKEMLARDANNFYVIDVRMIKAEFGDAWRLVIVVMHGKEAAPFKMLLSAGFRDVQMQAIREETRQAHPVGPCLLKKGESKEGRSFYFLASANAETRRNAIREAIDAGTFHQLVDSKRAVKPSGKKVGNAVLAGANSTDIPF